VKSLYILGVGILLLAGASPSTIAAEPSKHLLNLGKNKVALQGYDPVAFFTQSKPVAGDASLTSTYQGAIYQFATPENKATFEAAPDKYAPQFGGYCAYGVSRGYTAPIKVDAFQIVDGRLLLQYDKGARDIFNKDTQASLKKADANWPGLVAKNGK
jgi:YHS domain-containing protein